MRVLLVEDESQLAETVRRGLAAEGFIAHAFTTPEYLAEVSLPALAAGRGVSGRERTDVILTPFVVTGDDASAPRPYTVSVGNATSPPSRRIADARVISASDGRVGSGVTSS